MNTVETQRDAGLEILVRRIGITGVTVSVFAAFHGFANFSFKALCSYVHIHLLFKLWFI